jgi:beta-1,4-mannosyltransferase
MSVTVAAFPRSLRGNPYCDLLYRGVTAMGTRLAEPADFSPGWVFRNRHCVDVLHIHWPELYYRGRGGRVTPRSAAAFVGTLVLARALGYRIVWTVHNALPHDGHGRADRLLRWALVRMARLVVHAESARQVLPRSARRAIVVPHGHYIDAYPHDLDETAARRGLGLAAGDRVLLCFGQLRAYKGVPELLAAFAEVTHPGLRLVVAGRPVDEGVAEMVTAAAASDPRIIAHLVHVDDADVQLYFEAADWVVLPYREVLTSGSALLALSFARPVVAPRQGCLAELGPADGVLAYDPDRPHALATALAEAAATDARPWRTRALATARRSDWDTIARAYDRIFAGG